MNLDKSLKSKLILILPIMAGAFWGSGGLFIRPLAEAGLSLTTIIFAKTIIGAPITLGVILIGNRKQLHVKLKDLPLVIGAGVCGVFFLSYAYNVAVLLLSLSLASILLCMAPVFVLILSRVLFKEKITKTKIICMIFAFIGCGMICGLFEGKDVSWSYIGIGVGILSAVINAMYTMVSKSATRRGYGPLPIYLYSFTFISLILLPFADIQAMIDFLADAPAKATFIYIGHLLVTSLLPGTCYTLAIKHGEAGKTAILASGSEPVSALIFGMIFYSEIPTIVGFIGMIITVAALIVLISNGENKEKEGEINDENKNF